jgi:hypothetical protein
MFGQPKSAIGRLAKTLGISFYPQHVALLRSRERELNVPKSILLQLLLEIEQRDGLLRRELVARVTNLNTGEQPH